MSGRWFILVATAAVAAAVAVAGCGKPVPPGPGAGSTRFDPAGATYVGAAACAECHEVEHVGWTGSHHDLAMQPATPDTVLGDFDDAEIEHFGVTSTFTRRGESFIVRTDGPDGEMNEYAVAYVFGVEPLQQYLMTFPGGRYQTLALCWDTRPAADGGQRWYHIYPDELIDHEDPLHWTGSNQNWNYMCAECHSTDLRKNYDAATDTYDTTWELIDVSCEACHGPGSAHVGWARTVAQGGPDLRPRDRGLPVMLSDRDDAEWIFDPDATTAHRSPPRQSDMQIETCARCHSRRMQFAEPYVHGRPILDTHRVSLLEENLYYADGQILDEVYVYGSFLQSRMHAAGVTCADCHEPHGLGLRDEGNALCGRCHQPETFDTPSHHFHELGTPGSLCVDCHMTQRTYMVVDDRHDHSFRVPRPDLTASIGVPNACNGCHDDQPTSWAVDAIARDYGPRGEATPHYGQTLHLGRTGGPGAAAALRDLVTDEEMPGIARATAMGLLRRYPGPDAASALAAAVADPDPLVRAAAGGALDMLPPMERHSAGRALLDDPVRTVRHAAARGMAGGPEPPRLAARLEEVIATDLFNAERPESHLRIGNLQLLRDRPDEAEASFRAALRVDPLSLAARVNLADLRRMQGRDAEGQAILREAIELHPDAATAHYALGLLLVRERRLDEATAELERAVRLDPTDARFAFVYAVALHSSGRLHEAIAELEAVLPGNPADMNVLGLLVQLHYEAGNVDAAERYRRQAETITEGASRSSAGSRSAR